MAESTPDAPLPDQQHPPGVNFEGEGEQEAAAPDHRNDAPKRDGRPAEEPRLTTANPTPAHKGPGRPNKAESEARERARQAELAQKLLDNPPERRSQRLADKADRGSV